ncbi:hypothetical protein HYDPIDRAFT_33700 [Hydnomerulius pinastri MD-312]|uniref:Uncharacterized protein n=1 Tax=Hydnomerulius pinastri MD-312 TaxID=994086 RepID=A0A0C9VML5_9AGAM|nr:hypothetical protein HYDPIDRAFT_33700 [Hydnomerulius pinastri MD-312]
MRQLISLMGDAQKKTVELRGEQNCTQTFCEVIVDRPKPSLHSPIAEDDDDTGSLPSRSSHPHRSPTPGNSSRCTPEWQTSLFPYPTARQSPLAQRSKEWLSLTSWFCIIANRYVRFTLDSTAQPDYLLKPLQSNAVRQESRSQLLSILQPPRMITGYDRFMLSVDRSYYSVPHWLIHLYLKAHSPNIKPSVSSYLSSLVAGTFWTSGETWPGNAAKAAHWYRPAVHLRSTLLRLDNLPGVYFQLLRGP